tara:strand:- start:6497 stop:6667 length:171 start_codon:yes stop_codon:yes gene_type:complete
VDVPFHPWSSLRIKMKFGLCKELLLQEIKIEQKKVKIKILDIIKILTHKYNNVKQF